MKVLHIINTIATGGAENVLLNSIEGFKKYWPESNHYLLVLYGEGNDLRLVKFDEYRFLDSSLRKLFFDAYKVKKWIQNENFNIIHTHLWDALIFGRFLKIKNSTLIHTHHSIDYQKGVADHSSWRVLLDKFTYKGTPIVYVSQAVKLAVLSQIPRQNKAGVVIPNFCTEDFHYSYSPSSSEALKLIAVGNLKNVKNYSLLIKSLSHVTSRPIQVDIYGEGDLRTELQQQIDESKVNANLKGRYDISSNLYCDYDLFIMTSKIEGMPVALIEALTSGMPSLLPDHLPVMKELAEDSAWYFNSSEELVQLLENINKKELVSASLRAKDLSKRYSLKSYITSLKDLYSEHATSNC